LYLISLAFGWFLDKFSHGLRLMFIFTAIMAGIVFGAESVLAMLVDPESRFQSILVIAVWRAPSAGLKKGLLILSAVDLNQ
ncbi:hypothetical protein, partial [Siminovitchia fortis]|uniref:hypothetical protein n=1 Tax=Siminovitchia fortis TaxID=254758 RepID=UPI001C92F6BD